MFARSAKCDVPLDGRERAPIDRFLARLLLEELDEDVVTALGAPEIADILELVEPGCRLWLREPWTPARDASAREEFARLFLLPGGAPPLASAWIEGEREQLGAQFTSFVSRALDASGRQTRHSRVWGNLPLDHLGLLLDLTASLFSSEEGTGRGIGVHLQREALGPWVGAFGRTLRAKAALPIYRAAGGLLVNLSY